MRFTYKETKEISNLINEFQTEYWEQRQKVNYISELDNKLPLYLLDEIIDKITKLTNVNSKYVDFKELKSDLEFLKDYYEIRKWSSVNRWLSNINSVIKDLFSQFMIEIKSIKEIEKVDNERK